MVTAQADQKPMNLHAYWDRLLGSNKTLAESNRLANSLLDQKANSRANLGELRAYGQENGPDMWAGSEIYALASKYVYLEGLLQYTPRPERNAPELTTAPTLPDGYLGKAQLIANKQICLASYRLSDMLAGLK